MLWRHYRKTKQDGGAEASQPIPVPPIVIQQPKQSLRDWILISVTALPGIAAVIALIFTFASVQAVRGELQVTRGQLSIAAQGQITDRFNAAIANLGSSSIDVRLGGIYALQRVMTDSRRDQYTVIQVLAAFIRDHAPAVPRPIILHGAPPIPTLAVRLVSGRAPKVSTDIQAALTVLGNRRSIQDSIDLSYTNLAGANLDSLYFNKTSFFGADMVGINCIDTHLDGADFTEADLFASSFLQASVMGAHFNGANLAHAFMQNANLAYADFSSIRSGLLKIRGAYLSGADLAGANVKKTDFAGADVGKAIGI
jgi:hypothetical protein